MSKRRHLEIIGGIRNFTKYCVWQYYITISVLDFHVCLAHLIGTFTGMSKEAIRPFFLIIMSSQWLRFWNSSTSFDLYTLYWGVKCGTSFPLVLGGIEKWLNRNALLIPLGLFWRVRGWTMGRVCLCRISDAKCLGWDQFSSGLPLSSWQT